MQHDKARSLFFHDEDFLGAGERTWGLRDGHEVGMPAAKKGCVMKNSLVHRVRDFACESVTLTRWAGSNIARHIDEPRWPMVAGILQLADSLISAKMAACAAVTGANEMHVFWLNGEWSVC